MEHLGVVIPPSAFVNATFDLKQLAALAATSTVWNKFATAKADEILIAEIAARVPFVSTDGLVIVNEKETIHIHNLNFSRRKLVQFLDVVKHLDKRKKHQRYPKEFATVLSPDLFGVASGCKYGVAQTLAFIEKLSKIFDNGNRLMVLNYLYTAMMMHISLYHQYLDNGAMEKLAEPLRFMNTFGKKQIKTVGCHPIIASTFNKYSKIIESLIIQYSMS